MKTIEKACSYWAKANVSRSLKSISAVVLTLQSLMAVKKLRQVFLVRLIRDEAR